VFISGITFFLNNWYFLGKSLNSVILFFFRYNGVLPNGDKGRRKSKFFLHKKATSNGVKPVKHHLVKNPQQSEVIIQAHNN